MLPLEVYRSCVGLDELFFSEDATPRSKPAIKALVDQLLADLSESAPARDGVPLAASFDRQLTPRQRLYAHLIRRSPFTLSQHQLRALDRLLAHEAANRALIRPDAIADVCTIAGSRTLLMLWRGDITTLAADAIVNAANAELLGCFQPFHACIDNIIHSQAGPRLRDDCARIMQIQGQAEATGQAKITRAYHLPARFVIHSVGPIHRRSADLSADSRMLARCYHSCLDLAAQVSQIETLAFCCIATGIFGFPPKPACAIATTAVKEWLGQRPDRFSAVIFNVYQTSDELLYRSHLFSRDR